MSQLYHFSRKRRQLKNKLKVYQLALVLKQKELLVRLQSQIVKLSIFSDSKLFKKLAILGIFCTLGNPIKAQDILLNPPISTYESMRLIVSAHDFVDTVNYYNGIIRQNIRQTRFIDVDADGDLDIFFIASDEKCYNCGDDWLASTRLLFQENISTDTVAFDSIQLLLSLPYGAFPTPFDLVDFDNNSDYDLLFSDYNGFKIFENNSNQYDEFYFDEPVYISMSNVSIGSFYITDLLDVDNDGDLDLVTNSIYDFNNLFYYENDGSNSLFPFDTVKNTFNLGLELDTAINETSGLAFDFVDIDKDGNEDLLIQAYFNEDDLDDYLYPTEARLYYYKNLSNSGWNFNPIGEQLLETDLKRYPEGNYFTSTFYNAVDIDGDGDIDINKIKTSTSQPCGYCGSYTGLEEVLIYKNVIEEITGITSNQSVLELEVLGNPTHDKSIIRFKNDFQNTADLKIYTSTGVLVKHLKTNESSFMINRKNLANGIYIYSVILDGKAASGKLILN